MPDARSTHRALACWFACLVVLTAVAGCGADSQGHSCTSAGRADTERVAAAVGKVIFGGSYEPSLAEHFHGCDDTSTGVYDFNGTPAITRSAVPKGRARLPVPGVPAG